MNLTKNHIALHTPFRYIRMAALVALTALLSAVGVGQSFAPVAWPSDGTWTAYNVKGDPIQDPKNQDPSNGGTSPQSYVNLSSGVPDGTRPTAYYQTNGTHLFIRFRLESTPNAYGAADNAANGDPWRSALWTFLLDIEGDGWRDFAVVLNGSSGSPAEPIDKIQIIYSRLTDTQSLEFGTPGIYLLAEIFAAQEYTSGPNTGELKQFDGNGNEVTTNPWPNPNTTVYDFGTSRVIDETASGGDYLLDFQVPVSLLDASAYNGPSLGTSTIMSAAFTTSNSLNDPFQKDFAYIEAFCADVSNPMPGGDPFTMDNQTLPKIVVTDVEALYCPTVELTTRVLTAQRLLDCNTVVSSVVTNNFYYWYDENQNGLADEAGTSWTLIGPGMPSTLGEWTATWNTASLPRGQYLVKVVATDQASNTTDSYLQNLPQFPNVYAVLNNTCGINPGTVTKSVTPPVVSANDPAVNREVTYTLSVSNPQASTITLDTLYDVLPSTFSYISTTGGTLTPTTSPGFGATGTIAWIFNPATSFSPGASKRIVFKAQAGTTPATYTNSAFARGSTFFTAASNVAPVVVTNTGASLSKSVSTAAGINPGDQITYTLTYQNTGSVPLTDLVVTDSLVQGLTFLGATTGAVVNGRTVTWTFPSVPAGATGSLSITVLVTNPYAGTNPLTNSARLTANELFSTVFSNTVSNTVLGAVLSLSKSSSPSNAIPGNTITYTLVYNNVGTASGTNVSIIDTLPPNVSYVPGSSTPLTPIITNVSNPTRTALTWTIGTIEAGNTNLNNSITFQATVINPYPTVGDAQQLDNTAVIVCDQTAPYFVTSPIFVTASPIVSLTKSSDKTVYTAGDSATFTLTLTNTGTFTASLDTLQDAFPNLFKYGWTGGGSLTPTAYPTAGDGGIVTWRFVPAATIAPGETKTLVFRAATSPVGVNYTNNAYAKGILNGGTQTTISASLPITIAEGLEAINKSVDKTVVFAGDTLTYTIYYLNASGSKKTRIFSDTLSSALTFLSETHSFGTFQGAVGQALSWKGQNMNNGQTMTITIKALVNTGGTTIVNKASFDSSPISYSNTVTTVGEIAPALTFTKTPSQTSAAVNTEITYTLAYANAPGVNPSTSTTIIDTIPSWMTYVQGSASNGGSFEGLPAPKGRLVWNIGSIPPNSNGALTFRTTIDGNTPVNTVITNTARLFNAEGQALSASANDTVKALANMTLVKSVDAAYAGPGDTLTYTISHKNAGTGPASSVVITDSIPQNTVFVDAANGGSLTGDVVTWNLGTQNANDSSAVSFRVRILAPLASGSISTIRNTARVSAAGLVTKVSNQIQTTMIYPQLYPSKSTSADTASPLSILTYTISVSNSTIIAGTESILKDNIPANTTYVPNSTTLDGNPVSDTAGTSRLVFGLSLGTVTYVVPKVVTFQVQVGPAVTPGTVISNFARAFTSKVTDSTNGNTVQTHIVYNSSLILRKSVASPDSIPGSILTYTLRYGTVGAGSANSVVVLDTLPPNTTYISGSVSGAGANYDGVGNRIVINAASIAPNDTNNIVTYLVQVASPLLYGVYTIENTAYASAQASNPATGSASIPITASSVLNVSKTGPTSGQLSGTPTPADTVQFTIDYSITGNATLSDVVLKDLVDPAYTYLSSSPAGSVTVDSVTWSFGTLTPGASGQVTITFATTSAGSITNTAELSTTSSPGLTVSDALTTTFVAFSFATSTKSYTDIDGGSVTPPDTIEYLIHIENTGSGPATSVTVTDTVPSGLSIIASTVTGGTINGQMITWTIASIGAGATNDLTFSATVDSSIAHNIPVVNEAHIDAEGYRTTVSTSFTPVNSPVMTLVLDVNTPISQPDDTLTYTATYANIGTATAVTVFLTVPGAPLSTSYVPESCVLNGSPMTDQSGDDQITLSGTTIVVNLFNVLPGQGGTLVFKAIVQ